MSFYQAELNVSDNDHHALSAVTFIINLLLTSLSQTLQALNNAYLCEVPV